MKVLVISDTHRKDEKLKDILRKECNYEGNAQSAETTAFDVIIHAGDLEGSDAVYEQCCAEFHTVAGNNDFLSDAPQEDLFCLGPCKVFLTHGHLYRVNLSEEILVDEAKAHDADILIFGHTHRPMAEYRDDLLVINPGSLSYPRQSDRTPSYAVMEVGEEGVVSYGIRFLDE